MDYFLEEKDKDGNFDYRARSSVAWDYEGCMYYLKPFREKFAEYILDFEISELEYGRIGG